MKPSLLAIAIFGLLVFGVPNLRAQVYGPYYYGPYWDPHYHQYLQYQNYFQWQQYLEYLRQTASALSRTPTSSCAVIKIRGAVLPLFTSHFGPTRKE
jgi:hypothetical protein